MNLSLKSHQLISELISQVETVFFGKRETVTLIITALFAGGHVLIEDIPGVGKTVLVRTIAQLIGADFKRIQFTPDLLPSDITGMSIYNQKDARFEFRPGPLMGNIILADEINRTSPKTQSALLEGMAEGRVTVDGVTHRLPEFFFVMATQNPIDYEGTYALPEAQLDRFLLKLSIGYPSREDELALLDQSSSRSLEAIEPILTVADILSLRRHAAAVHVSMGVKGYLMDIVQATREHPLIRLGVSPRGAISFFRTLQAYAFVARRNYVIPDDVKAVAPYALAHRIILSREAVFEHVNAVRLIGQIVATVKVPTSEESAP